MWFYRKTVKSAFIFGLLLLQSAAFAMQSTTVDAQQQPVVEFTPSDEKNKLAPADQQATFSTTLFGKVVSALFSFESQLLIATASRFADFIAFNNIVSSCKPLHSIPSAIEDACRKMSFDLDPNKIFTSPEISSACAYKDTVYLNDKFLENHTAEQTEFVVGHEIAHLQLNHGLKNQVALPLLTISPLLFAALIKFIEKKYAPVPGTSLHKFVELSKKLQKTIVENPLLWFLIVKLGYCAYSRYQEQQADLYSAQKTGQIAGGISFFKKYLPYYEQSRFSWLNPINLLSKANSFLFGSHPPLETRIEYLKALQK